MKRGAEPQGAPPEYPQPVSGPAYGPTFRALATLIAVAVVAMAVRAGLQMPQAEADVPAPTWLLGLGLLAFVASYWLLIRSTTTVDATGIRQTGLVETRVAWGELRSARLFGPPFARRLMVRTGNGRIRFFFGASPDLLDAFARIAQAYRR